MARVVCWCGLIMSDETFAAPTSTEPGPALTPPSEEDYDAICAAVMETVRGRWFLSEYSRRNRHADTELVLSALDRIEMTLRGERTSEDVDRLRHDLTEMAKAITLTKTEIAAIKPDGQSFSPMGDVTEELDSVVLATEQATANILAAAAQIQEVAWTMREQGSDARLADQLEAYATDIHAAGSAQSFNNQRAQKVVHVMRYLEGRINDMIDVWGGYPAVGTPALASPARRSLPAAVVPEVETETTSSALLDDVAEPLPASSPNANHLNGNGHDARPANGSVVIDGNFEQDIETAVQKAVAAANVADRLAEATTSIHAETDASSTQQPNPSSSQQEAASQASLEGSPETPDRPQAVAPAEGLMSTSADAVLVVPVEEDGDRVPLRQDDSTSTPLVVLSQPAFHSGPVVVAPESEWANGRTIDAVPALDSVLVISDDNEQTPAATDTTAVSDLYALHVERSVGPRSERTLADIGQPLDDARSSDQATQEQASPVDSKQVFEFDLEPLSTGAQDREMQPEPEAPAPGATTLQPSARLADPMAYSLATPGIAPRPPSRSPLVVTAVSAPTSEPTQQPRSEAASAPVAPPARTEAKGAQAQISETKAPEAKVGVQPSLPAAPDPPVDTPAAAMPVAAPPASAKVQRPSPAAAAPVDPLAAIAALSDEEKIALFS
jgi:hypothetical protein